MALRDNVLGSRRIRVVVAGTIAANLLFGIATVAAHEPRVDTEVVWTMVDVTEGGAQGDAHLIEAGDFVALIDAGTYEAGRSQLVPYLHDRGIDRLDLVFVTHVHGDHYGGLKAVIEAGIAIDRVEMSIPDGYVCQREVPWGCSRERTLDLLSMLAQARIPVGEPTAPMEWTLGGHASLALVQRLDGDDPEVGTIDVNDTSIVLRLDVGNNSVLFTGDLNTSSGDYLTRRDLGLRPNVLLKVPHHGTESLPSDDFFVAIDPDIAFVPAPAGLWSSDRSRRPRMWFEGHHVPTFVSGEVGHVTVHLGDHFRIDTERPARNN